MTNYNMEVYRGDNKTYEYTVWDASSSRVDLSSSSITMSVRTKETSTSYIFQRQNVIAGGSDSEIGMSNASSGMFQVYIVPENTQSSKIRTYVYDIEIVKASSVHTIVKDNFTIKADVTR